jgi:hypothetical protein
MTEQKVHGNTRKAAEMALAKRLISRSSYGAILAGTLTLAEAKSLGRDRGPHDTGQASDGPGTATETPRRSRTARRCMCSCGQRPRSPRSLFVQGHDAILRSELVAQIKKGDVLLRSERITPEQRRYAVERGLAGPEVLPEEERDG